MRIIGIILIFAFLSHFAYAQNYQETLRYSQFQFGSSARTQGVAGAFGAMGADFGGVTINPASLAEYKVSDFSFTPSFGFDSATAELERAAEGSNKSTDFVFNFEQIGVVIAKIPPGNWTTSNWSIGFTKLANYDQNFDYVGTTNGSIIGRFIENAPGDFFPEDLDDFEAGPAYEIGAIFFDDFSGQYVSDFEPFATPVFKEQTINRKGGFSEINIGWAGSYDNKFNLGLSVNFPIVSFSEEKLYRESDPQGTIDVFEALTFSEFLTTTGGGINAKLGIQYKINNRLRFGLAYHSPTVLGLKDDFYTVSYYAYDDGIFNEADSRSPDASFDYRVTNPGRFIASTGYLFKSNGIAGFVNADIEYINYTHNSFNLTSSDQSSQADQEFEDFNNAEIDANFSKALNYRLGSELAKGHYRIRAGVAINQNPFKNASSKFDTNLSLGVGYRGESWYLDLATFSQKRNETYTPFFLSVEDEEQRVEVDNSFLSTMLTLGFKF